MPPRRDRFGDQLDFLQQEFQRLRADFDGGQRQHTPTAGDEDPEGAQEEETFPHDFSSGDERRPPARFGRGAHQRRGHDRPPRDHGGYDRPPRDHGDHDRPPRDYGVKVEIPAFDGGHDPDDFIDWVQEVDRILEYKEIPPDRQVKLVSIRLKKGASLWWENLKRHRLREGKRKITDWEKMKKELQKKYLPSHYKQDVFWKLHHIQQGEKTVEAYTAEFEQLMMKCDLQEPEENTLTRYLGGLRPSIGNVVQLQSYWTLLDVQKLAVKVERQQKKVRPFPPSRPTTGVSPPRGQRPPFSGPTRPPATTTESSESKKSEKSGTSSKPLVDARQCFKCHGFGHIASGCPTRNLIIFNDGHAYEPEYSVEEPTKEEEWQLEADDGDLLVLRRSLQLAVAPGEEWLRHNIFRTRCTVGGKVCSLLIDSGSCENVVSHTMIDKLKLSTQNHPSPYSLSWLKKGTQIKVDRRCLVEFSIGTQLQEQVWCDVVPMDACHILLGRPWQYDRNAIHDGRKNTYTFVKDGKKIALLPWKGADIGSTVSCGLTPRTPLFSEEKENANIVPEEPDELQRQIEEIFAASVQPRQPTSLSPVWDAELAGDPVEIETIDMVIPPAPTISEMHVLLGHTHPPPLEHKHLTPVAIPKHDAAWVKLKKRKISVGSLNNLQYQTIVSTSTPGKTAALTRKKPSPPPGENDRVGPEKASRKYYSRRIKARIEDPSDPAEPAGPGGAGPAQTETQ